MIWQWDEFRGIFDRMVRNPLITAFCLSLAVHLAFFGGYKLGDRLGWWKTQATWLLNITKKHRSTADRLTDLLKMAQKRQEIPLTFIEVDPSTVVPESPKDAKYYGAKNSLAANPDPILDSTVPKADGKQDKVPRLEDVPKTKAQPLQPSAPPEEVAAKPKETPGDTFKKPDGVAEVGTAQTKKDKPRTLADAMARKNLLAGSQVKQHGGVSRRGRLSFDVVGSPFGAYDAAIIAAIQQRWYDLLDNTPFTQRSGKVVLEFKLNYDGRISDMNMTGNEVGDILALLCQRAIMDPSPFPKWPDDMRRMVGKNYREVLFTFYYE